MKLIRTNSSNPDFHQLCNELDKELTGRYGDSQSTYDGHNKIVPDMNVVIGYIKTISIACGCFKPVNQNTVEVKRMYVNKKYRGKGISSIIMKSLEEWCVELGYSKAILGTGKRQPEALALYTKQGYKKIKNYGPYIALENSICMEKQVEKKNNHTA